MISVRSRTGSHKRARAKVAIAVGCVAAALGVAACGGGGGGSDTGGSSNTVVIGANTELSGSLQIYGLPGTQGFQLGADAINKAGGVKVGGKSYQLTVKAQDNRSDPSQIVNASRAVVDSGAIAALGPDLGSIPAYQVFKQANIITFTPEFALQQELIKNPQGNPLLFSPTVFLQELYTTNMRQLKALYPQIKTVAIISPNDQQGQGTAEAYKFAAEGEGLSVVGVETYPVGSTDFSSILTSFKQKHPDLLIAEQTPEQGAAILQQAAQLGVAPYALNDTMTPDQALKVPGIGNTTVILPSFSPTFSPAATIPDYKPEEVFGTEQPKGVPGAVIDSFYTTHLLAQAMEQAGTVTDAAAIAKALPGQSFTGGFGTCTMTQRREVSCETLVQVVAGGKVTVYRFPNPNSVTPTATYLCQGGNCQRQ